MDVTVLGRVVACTERSWDAKVDTSTGEVKSKAGSFRQVHVVQRFESEPVAVRVLDETLWRKIRDAGSMKACRIDAELKTFSDAGQTRARESLTLISYAPADELPPVVAVKPSVPAGAR